MCLVSGFLFCLFGSYRLFCVGSRLVIPTLYRILSCELFRRVLFISDCLVVFAVCASGLLFYAVPPRYLHSLSVEVLLLFICGTSNGSYVSSMWSLIEYLTNVSGCIFLVCSGTSMYSSEYL